MICQEKARDDMTSKEQIERISKLLNELDLDDITSAEFDEMFPKQSINDLKDELWRMYCFAEDVCYTINMGDTAEQEPKIGHWSHDGSHWKNRWICSECGYKLIDEQTRFCPDCGAKMEEIQIEAERSDEE